MPSKKKRPRLVSDLSYRFQGMTCRDALDDEQSTLPLSQRMSRVETNQGRSSRCQVVQVQTSPYKTELCKYYSMKGYCRNGDACHFAHGKGDLIIQPLVKAPLSPTDEVEQAIAKNLYEWGIDPNSSSCSQKGKLFFRKAIEAAIKEFKYGSVSSKISKNKDCEPHILPASFTEAIRHVLLDDIKSPKVSYTMLCDKISDTYGEEFGFPPFWANEDRLGNLTQKLRREFKGIPPHMLDPFTRFSSFEVDKKEYVHWLYFESEESCLLGLVFEAITASHAIHNASCPGCYSSNSLRWMGGYSSPWKDLVCINCDSTFEIKSKASDIKIMKEMKHNCIQGGSFSHYHQLRRETKGCVAAKKYLVLVNRNPLPNIWASGGTKSWDVDLVDIDNVMPRLEGKSFTKPVDEIRLKSNIRVKVETRKPWFRIPFFDFDPKKLAREVFDSYFSEDVQIPSKVHTPPKRTRDVKKEIRPTALYTLVAKQN